MAVYSGDGGANNYVGTDGPDVIYGNGGNDTLEGGGGNDTILGGDGEDTLRGGTGDDAIDGGAGNDLIDGGSGNDLAYYDSATSSVTVDLSLPTPLATGGGGTDILVSIENVRGSVFNDILRGNALANLLHGGSGDDILYGMGGTDTMIGDTGNDELYGGDSHDYLYGGEGDDLLDGGSGNDLAYYDNAESAVTVSLLRTDAQATGGAGTDRLISIENLRGSSFNDTLTGNAQANVLVGGDGNDLIRGGGGLDTLIGETGNDDLYGEDGNDYLSGGDGDDLIDGGLGYDLAYYDNAESGVTVSLSVAGPQTTGGAGTDRLVSIENLRGSNFRDLLTGNAFANVIVGMDGDDILRGLIGNDTLAGDAGNDELYGDEGSDYLTGGDGDDLIDGGSGIDRAEYLFAQSGVTVDLRLTGPQATGGAGSDRLIGIENLLGSGFDDFLTGDSAVNVLSGGDGNDRLDGGGGIDTLIGGYGDDIYFVDDRFDVVTELAGEGTDTFISTVSFSIAGLFAENLTLTGSAVQGQGNDFANVIIGNDGLNKLDGGGGDDQIHGGAGRDRLTGGAGADGFYFSHTGAAHADKITDFSVADDTIFLDRSVFTAIGLGQLASNAFRLGTVAQDADDRILYDQTLGYIYYDADGSGAGEAVLIAAVTGGTALTNADFWGY